MGARAMSALLPPIPEGFELAQPATSLPPIPDGFVLDQERPSLLQSAISPITSYPSTQREMAQGGMNRMAEGASDVRSSIMDEPHGGAGAVKFIKGAASVPLGAAEYVLSPINAALRTVIGKPVEDATGIPKEYTEFAAAAGLPTKLPRLPTRAPTKPAPPVPTREELFTAADAGYKAPEVAAIEIKPTALRDFSISLRSSLNDVGVDENLAPKTFAILSNAGKAPAGSIVTGKNLESLRRTLGNAAKSTDPTERMAAKQAIDAVDGFFEGLPASNVIAGDSAKAAAILQNARGNYAAAKRSEKIDAAVDRADLNAASANSGQNIDNATRQRIKAILVSPKERRGFSPEELRQMELVVRGTYIGNAARFVGNLLGGGGGLGAVTSAAVGGMATGGPGAIAPIVGVGLKQVANASTARQVAKLDQMIREHAPLNVDRAKLSAVEDAADQWAGAFKEAQLSQSPDVMKRLTVASRGLALSINRNLGIDAREMFEAIQGVKPARPDQNQTE